MLLCLSQTRIELCRWDPLQLIPGTLKDTPIVNAVSLEGFEWYNTVIDYSDGVRDPDEQLVPTLVKKVIFPRIEHYIKIWDCSSPTQTQCLVDLMAEAYLFVEKLPDPLWSKLVDKASDRVMSFAKMFLAHPLSNDTNQNVKGYAGSALQERLCRRAVRVFENVMKVCSEYLEPANLQLLVLGVIVQPLLKDLKTYPNQAFAVMVLQRISELVPQSWLVNGEIPELHNAQFITKPSPNAGGPQARIIWQSSIPLLRKLKIDA